MWVSEAALWTDWELVGTLETAEPCELVMVKAAGFLESIKTHDSPRLVTWEYTTLSAAVSQPRRTTDAATS